MKRRSLAPKVVFSTPAQSISTSLAGTSRLTRIELQGSRFHHYEALAACRDSGQIDDRTWQAYLADDDFAAWYFVEQLDR